ncbi:MAG: B12-binding domain-containing radical SAM protein [Chloroflexi bacterium]|nr:B12-binding domain-containing radical SAM protein [Chloroflexota bacterium]
MTSVLLIYPYFNPSGDRSIFRFPPLGVGYVAASLKNAGHEVSILDCTFMDRRSALEEAAQARAEVVGIYSMVTMKADSLIFARHLRGRCRLLIAGGPLPSSDPASFVDDFDVVISGEGEKAAPEVLDACGNGHNLAAIPGIAYRDGGGQPAFTGARPFEASLDGIPFPARELMPNDRYIAYWKRRGGPPTTTIMTTRGCPFSCEFCSNAVFKVSYRQRSPANVVDEVEQALSLGYERIHFADDVFTLKKERVIGICDEITSRRLRFRWECLARADSVDRELVSAMKSAGCDRIFFGVESGNDTMLRLMGKRITVDSARRAVQVARDAGISTGAFFILCYPGDTDDTVLSTLRFATSLPLDYLSFTVPYPLPGTPLYERVNGKREWRGRSRGLVPEHSLVFKGDFSQAKMKFAILKGRAQFLMRRGSRRYLAVLSRPFEAVTDLVFRLMR